MFVPKSAACAGCPLETVSARYEPDDRRSGSTVYVLGSQPGDDPDSKMESTFLPLAGLVQGTNVSTGNIIRCRNGKDSLPPAAILKPAIEHCKQAHEQIPESVKVVVTQGAAAWNHTQGRTDLSITAWRGRVGPILYQGRQVYGTLHLDDIATNKNPRMAFPTKEDWARVPRIVSGEWPKPLPPRIVLNASNVQEMRDWFAEAHDVAPYLSWDTEYFYDQDNKAAPDNHLMQLVGIGYPGMSMGLQVEWIGSESESWERAEFVRLFYKLCLAKRHLGHNFESEIRCVQRTFGWKPEMFWGRFDDTMLAHATLWSELAHDLGFLESQYSEYEALKHLWKTDMLKYNWGDVLTPICAWAKMSEQLKRDPASEGIYRNQYLKLVQHKYYRETHGILVNQERVAPALAVYKRRTELAEQIAQAYCGWPINLKSPAQLAHWLYDVEGFTASRSKKTKGRTVNGDAIATLRSKTLPFDAEFETEYGFTEEYLHERLEAGGHPLLEACVLHSESKQVLSHYLLPLMKGD